MDLTSLSLILGGGVVGLAGVAHLGDLIKPNSLVGLRIRSTSTSAEAWHAGQRAYAPWLILSGVLCLSAGISIVLGDDSIRTPVLVVSVGGAIVSGLISVVRGHCAAVAADEAYDAADDCAEL